MNYGRGMSRIRKGDPFPLTRNLGDDRTDRFIRADIIRVSDFVTLNTVNVPHIGNGVYGRSDIFSSEEGTFKLVFRVYRDLQFTKRDKRYPTQSTLINVENIINEIVEQFDDSDGRIT